jgi:hypothetical protein
MDLLPRSPTGQQSKTHSAAPDKTASPCPIQDDDQGKQAVNAQDQQQIVEEQNAHTYRYDATESMMSMYVRKHDVHGLSIVAPWMEESRIRADLFVGSIDLMHWLIRRIRSFRTVAPIFTANPIN